MYVSALLLVRVACLMSKIIPSTKFSLDPSSSLNWIHSSVWFCINCSNKVYST